MNAVNGRFQSRAHPCNEGRSLQYIHEEKVNQGERNNATLEGAIASEVEVTADTNHHHVIPERIVTSTESKCIIYSALYGLVSRTSESANYDVWRRVVGFMVNDLRMNEEFPNKPTTRTTISTLRVEFNETAGYSNDKGMYGHRIYGYLVPPTSGEYSFIVEATRITCAFSVELWLSTDHDPMKSRKILAGHRPPVVPPPNVTRIPLSYTVPSPRSTRLEDGRVYYFEFFEKAFDGAIVTEVKWKIPGASNYTSLPPSYFAMAIQLNKTTGQYVESPMATALLGPLPTLVLQHQRTQALGDTVIAASSVEFLPSCSFRAEYASEHKVKRYKGVYEVFESTVFPPDDTWFRQNTAADTGNGVINYTTASNIFTMYKNALEESTLRGEVVGLCSMEETRNKESGWRYLLEMDIKIRGQDNIVHVSEYVYLPSYEKSKLCHLHNFQWVPNVDVYLVVSLKNLGVWVTHLVDNMEQLYAQTHDDHFELVVVDYESQDMDVESVLKNSALKRWKYIKKSGPFSRSGGLQDGIDYVTDPNSIVMTIDMHLTLPMGFVEYTRKHVIQGKMGYAPMFFRLGPGYTETNVNGFWETLTYGVYGLYKSDWTVIGGFNTKLFTKWGGEDWEVLDRTVAKGYEVFRIRPPGLVHYYHTRDGLWNTAKSQSR
eukprot:Em0018g681a